MSDPLFHANAIAQCPHAPGTVTVVSASQRVKVSGNAVATMGDTFTIKGCSNRIGTTSYSPCTTLVFLEPAKRVKVNGQFAILKTSRGQCQNGPLVQGSPQMMQTQTRAKGT